MKYVAHNLLGSIVAVPTLEQMHEVLASLAGATTDTAGVSLSHESGWRICAHADGRTTIENHETDEDPGFMRGLSSEQVLLLWQLLADGELNELLAMPWAPGDGT